MAVDVEVRDLQVPGWARGCLLAGALLQMALGGTMLLQPQLFVAVSSERLAWQAVGILELAMGAALVAAFLRPVRNVSLIAAGVAIEIAGIGALLYVALTGSAEWASTWPLIGVVAAGALLLALPLTVVWRQPEAETVPSVLGSRPMTTTSTTLFGLQQTLQALAAPATIQLAMFPDLVGNGERVMAEFKLWRERALQKRELLTPQQQEALAGLDECLHKMLQDSAKSLWSDAAVRAAPEWSQLRATARRALVAFAWSVDMPVGVLKRRRESPSSVDMRTPS